MGRPQEPLLEGVMFFLFMFGYALAWIVLNLE